MNSLKVKFKKLSPDAVTPTYAKIGDAGLDLTAVSSEHGDNYIEYKTGIAVEIPDGHVGLLFPRSSVTNKNMMMKNSTGIIDSKFRGELRLRFKGFSFKTFGQQKIYDNVYKKGDRVGQLIIVPIPTVELEEVTELSETERGTGGYGSTGN
jgi:dUTP pyrophosphatase